ncbi:hypothetical protein [Cardinium endosymbiont of Nabis limbatus]|uniref:hypothetical protein n=1 Tax=Cardinium endosymbiont of Nabis limbatus TaxID=3066217 RepID=UPI003AF3957C
MLVIAVLGIFLSLNSSTLSAIRTMSNWFDRFYIPIIAAPFILAVLGFRTTARNALMGMAAGALAVIAWRKLVAPLLLTASGTFPCVLVNGLVMLAVHYLWPRSRRVEKLDDDGG